MSLESREQRMVELVSPDGVAIGECTVADAHRPPGQLHRAFSVVLQRPNGDLLLQQRAKSKLRFAELWSNSCCGHPAPGESLVAAAQHRLAEELGYDVPHLTAHGHVIYQAGDGDQAEHEFDHVLLGQVDHDPPQPDPAELAAWDWVSSAALADDLRDRPERYTPWFARVVALARQATG